MDKPIVLKELRVRWASLLRSLDVDESLAAELFDDLVASYEEDGRHYHGVAHIYHVLSVIDDIGAEARDLTAVLLAAWYHDVIYDVRATDNEARSAAYAGQALQRMGIDGARNAAVQEMIRATEIGRTRPDDIDTQVLLDADLASLASDPSVYDKNTRAIRKEFAHVPEDEFRKARAELLNRFLQRERIFATDAMHEKHETRARANLRREIAALDD